MGGGGGGADLPCAGLSPGPLCLFLTMTLQVTITGVIEDTPRTEVSCSVTLLALGFLLKIDCLGWSPGSPRTEITLVSSAPGTGHQHG